MKHLILIVTAFLIVGCATSYQDRLDALNVDSPSGGENVPEGEDGFMSRNDIPLSGACIINADCATTQFCELGICVTECNEAMPCPEGQFCSARGRCVSSPDYIDVNSTIKATPPVNWSVDEHVISLDTGENSGSFNVQVSGGGTLHYRVQVEPQDARDAVTVSEEEGLIATGGTKRLTVNVDRSKFGEGDHRVAVNVVSDGGQKIVIYEFSNGVSGRYGGFIDYQNPGLGRIPLIIDIKANSSGSILGRVVTAGSVLFPEERTIIGSVNTTNNTMFLSFLDLMMSGGDHDPFERNIGREIYIFGEIDEQRVIKGTFEEIISGLLPSTINVSGEIYLTRVTTDVGSITAYPDPTMPAFPTVDTSYVACSGFSSTCDSELDFRSDMVGCSTSLRSSAYRLGDDFAGTDSEGEPIVNFGLVEECKSDVASSGTNACVNISDLLCLKGDQQNYLLNSLAQDVEYSTYFEDLKNIQRLYSFIGNDHLVDAYRTAIEEVSNPLSLELSRLGDALDAYENAEQAFFGAANVAVMNRADSSVVSDNEYDIFRVPLQYIRSSQTALKRIVSLTLRRDLGRADRKAELREKIQNHARIIFLEGIALAHLINTHGGAFGYELAQVADELRSVSRTAGVLEAGVNPLGFSDDYVPFIYDPADTLNPTNFAQLVTMSTRTVNSAVEKAELAAATTELMEIRTEEIQQRIENIELNFESEIRRICGVDSIDDIGECGWSGGELALAFNDIEQQYLAIEQVHQQIMDTNEIIKIKRDTALQIMNVKNKTLMFLQTSGSQLEVLEMASAEVKAAELRKQGMFGSIGGFFSGIASIAGGFGSMAIEGFTPGYGSGGIAGGVSGIINAGLGGAMAANSADAAMAQGRIAQKKTHLNNLRQMRFQEEGMAIDAIRAAEEVKMLLIQMAELNLALEREELRLGKYVIQANNIIDHVDFLMHQRDVFLAQAIDSVNNPLTNLSFRLKRDHAVLLASQEFEKALEDVYLTARGLEHELNVEIPQIGSQLFQANSAQKLQGFLTCLSDWHDDYRIAFGSPHEEVTQISLREDVLGFKEAVTDEVTGEVTTPEELFRRVLLNPKYITQSGRVEYPFVMSIAGGSKEFSTLVCNDRIKKIRMMLVGSFLGDNEATIMLRQEGGSHLRDCSADPSGGSDIINTYHLDSRNALVQAGVNSFGLSSPNYELTGRGVASDRWVLVIPTGEEAPNNRDVDFLNIDDVVIEITHTARTLNSHTSSDVFGECNI